MRPLPLRLAKPPTIPRVQQGATLIEVLVAVVVLAIGLLGLAGLQMSSLQSNHSAYLRSQASLLAYDLADRMRAKRDASLAAAYDDGADGDRASWDASVAAVLGPDASGTIARVGADVTITIKWDDARGCIKDTDHDCGSDDAGTDKTFVYRTQI